MSNDLGFGPNKSGSNPGDVGRTLSKKVPNHDVGMPISWERLMVNWSKNSVGPRGWLPKRLGWFMGVP